jgi:hypothetical protein
MTAHRVQCGEIVEIRLPRKSATGKSKGYAYIEFKEVETRRGMRGPPRLHRGHCGMRGTGALYQPCTQQGSPDVRQPAYARGPLVRELASLLW